MTRGHGLLGRPQQDAEDSIMECRLLEMESSAAAVLHVQSLSIKTKYQIVIPGMSAGSDLQLLQVSLVDDHTHTISGECDLLSKILDNCDGRD